MVLETLNKREINKIANINTVSIYNNYFNGFEQKREEIKTTMRRYGFYPSIEGDVVVVVGGDGTFLGAIKEKIKDEYSPMFLGLNKGNLGFLYEYDFNELETVFRLLKKNQFKVVEYPIYEACILFQNNQEEIRPFINDFVIERKRSKVIHLNLKVNFDFAAPFTGDGIIVSSSLGSSAYNHSAKGSILLEELGTFQITPISPIVNQVYRSFQQSILLKDNHHILVENTEFKNRDMRIVLDGEEIQSSGIKHVKIKHSGRFVKLLRSETFEHMNHINQKMF